MSDAEKRLGAGIRELRVAAGMTQDQLAQALSAAGWAVRQNTIAKLENGLRPTTVSDMLVLAEVFGVSPSDLMMAMEDAPSGGDENAQQKYLLKSRLPILKAQLKASRAELLGLELEAKQLRERIEDLELAVGESEAALAELDEGAEGVAGVLSQIATPAQGASVTGRAEAGNGQPEETA